MSSTADFENARRIEKVAREQLKQHGPAGPTGPDAAAKRAEAIDAILKADNGR